MCTLHFYRAKEKPSKCQNSEIEYNANLDSLGFSHFITFKECRKVP